MNRYRCFGLVIECPLSLPLPLSSASPSVSVFFDPPAPCPGEEHPLFLFSPDAGLSRVRMFPTGVGVFTVEQGQQVRFAPDSHGNDVDECDLYLTGAILGLLLYQRGVLVLHGSVVEFSGRAVGFLGCSGAGKSSVAAACYTHNLPVLADDMVAVQFQGRHPRVQPGFPRVKTHTLTAETLHISPDKLEPVHPAIDDELALDVADRFPTVPLPLSCLYLLEIGDEEIIRPVPPARALVELLPHSVPSRYGQNGDAHQFRQLATLLETVPVYRLTRPADLSRLHRLPGIVQRHLAELR